MTTDYTPALDLSDPRIGWGGWTPQNRHWIIVHGTAGDATLEAVQRTFIDNGVNGRPSSTHYAVGQDGRVAQFVPESEVAWGNGPITGPSGVAVAGTGNAHDSWWDTAYPGNANPPTFSIEHCKPDTNNNSGLTSAQTGASFALIAHLCGKWGIPKRVYGTNTPANAQGGITGHFSMDPLNRRFCPGTYPWAALQAYLDGAALMLDISQVSGFFTANPDGSWQHGAYTIRAGMLQYYRTYIGTGSLYGFTQFGLPLSSEIATGTPKPGSTAQPTVQHFERATLAYDPDRVLDAPPGAEGAIYAAHVGAASSGVALDLTRDQVAHVKAS